MVLVSYISILLLTSYRICFLSLDQKRLKMPGERTRELDRKVSRNHYTNESRKRYGQGITFPKVSNRPMYAQYHAMTRFDLKDRHEETFGFGGPSAI